MVVSGQVQKKEEDFELMRKEKLGDGKRAGDWNLEYKTAADFSKYVLFNEREIKPMGIASQKADPLYRFNVLKVQRLYNLLVEEGKIKGGNARKIKEDGLINFSNPQSETMNAIMAINNWLGGGQGIKSLDENAYAAIEKKLESAGKLKAVARKPGHEENAAPAEVVSLKEKTAAEKDSLGAFIKFLNAHFPKQYSAFSAAGNSLLVRMVAENALLPKAGNSMEKREFELRKQKLENLFAEAGVFRWKALSDLKLDKRAYAGLSAGGMAEVSEFLEGEIAYCKSAVNVLVKGEPNYLRLKGNYLELAELARTIKESTDALAMLAQAVAEEKKRPAFKPKVVANRE